MFKFNIVFFISVISIFFCYEVPANNITMPMVEVMEKESFNTERFEKNREGSEWKFTRTDGVNVRQIAETDGYTEELNKPDSPYEYINVYNKKGNLKIKAQRFYSMDSGEWLYFDGNQTIINKVNYDKPYKLTIEALATIMQQNYDVNIMDTSKTFLVERYIDEKNIHKPLYEVHAYMENGKVTNAFNSYLVDGDTGKVLFKTETSLHEGEGLYRQYIMSTDEFKKGIYHLEDNVSSEH